MSGGVEALIKRLEENQHDPSAPPHLSASSISKHMRCPRQWQQDYILGERGPSSAALEIGNAVHLGLERLFSGQELGNPWKDNLGDKIVEWEVSPDDAENIYKSHMYHYWELVGKYLINDVVAAEQEFFHEIEGVLLPINLKIDLELSNLLIDWKSTKYFSRKGVRVNKEWVFQQGVYQLVKRKPSEIHVLTRAKNDPIVVPDSPSHPLHLGLIDTDKIETMIRDEWKRIQFHVTEYGLWNPWPGNSMHEWAGKYCGVAECCAL
jgi:hypothetical protein